MSSPDFDPFPKRESLLFTYPLPETKLQFLDELYIYTTISENDKLKELTAVDWNGSVLFDDQKFINQFPHVIEALTRASLEQDVHYRVVRTLRKMLFYAMTVPAYPIYQRLGTESMLLLEKEMVDHPDTYSFIEFLMMKYIMQEQGCGGFDSKLCLIMILQALEESGFKYLEEGPATGGKLDELVSTCYEFSAVLKRAGEGFIGEQIKKIEGCQIRVESKKEALGRAEKVFKENSSCKNFGSMVTSYLTYDMEQMMIRMRGEMLKRIAPNTLMRFFSPLLNIQGVSANEIEQAMDSLSDRYREKLLQKTFTEIQIEASEPFLETSEIVYQEADCAPIPESLKFSNPEDLKSSDTLKYLNF